MQDETLWAERLAEGEDSMATKNYQFFMSKEPREELSDIYEIDDEYLGRTKVRDVLIGMTRNAKPENKKKVIAYLSPHPHTRIEKAKDLQGWYQNKHNIDADTGKAHRPRPCFTDACLTEPWGGWCSVGCEFSLPAGELIDTSRGPKSIESFKVGDQVIGRREIGLLDCKVTGTSKHWKEEGLVILHIGSKQLKMTADHPVYSAARGWIEAGKLEVGELLEDIEFTNEVDRPKLLKIEVMPGGVEVFDIETETGNFFHQGILSHNCYVNSGFRGYRGSGLITVPLHYGAQIRKQLKGMRRAAAGYFSSFTDPFISLEKYYHNTQEAAQEFLNVGLPIFFLSRLKYPDWAIDMLTQNPHSYAQKSLNTSNPEDWRHLSPGALGLMDHLEDIRKIKKKGIYVSIQCNPIVPGVTSNEEIIKLFKMLADVGTDHVIVKFVEAGYSWAPAMIERMIKRFGSRGEKFAELFTENQGGQRCVQEEYRLKAHKLFSTYARMYGMTYATCYEYAYKRDKAGNIVDKTGVSIGREFTTSSQCHGPQNPIYRRESEFEKFKPMEECPPSGCLYCADENETNPGKARCGDELMGQAAALELKDFRVPIGQGKGRKLFGLQMISTPKSEGCQS
jgi:DNA repair photolyase